MNLRNLQEKVVLTFTVRINWSSDLKNFANSRPSVSNFKFFSRSLEQFFLTVGQNNFGNKIPLISKLICNKSKCQKYEWMINNTNVPFKATKVMIRFWIVNIEFCSKIIQTFFCSDKLFYWFKNVANLRLKADYFLDHYNDYFSQ